MTELTSPCYAVQSLFVLVDFFLPLGSFCSSCAAECQDKPREDNSEQRKRTRQNLLTCE